MFWFVLGIFFLSFVFSNLIMFWGIDFFFFSCLRFVELLISVDLCISPTWKVSSYYFFKMFLVLHSFSSLRDNSRHSVIVPQVPKTLLFFSFLLYRLDNFYCPIFKFTDCSVISILLMSPSSEFIISFIVFFKFISLINSFLYYLFLCEDFLFFYYFKCICSCSLKQFHALNSLSDNCDIFIIWASISVNCLFLYKLRVC